MGGCFSSDVQTKYAAGGVGGLSETKREAAEAAALATGSAAFSSWVELQVSCTNLKAADTFSRSDPIAVLYEKNLRTGEFKELGRTEVISNTSNPSFVKKIKVLYNFERVQELRVVLVDIDKGQNPETVNPNSCDQLGHAEMRLADIFTAKGKSLSKALQNTKSASSVTITAEEMSAAREVLTIQLAAGSLKNVDTFSKSDPFLEISKATEDGRWLPVYKTETIDNNLNPVWKPITVSGTQLNNGDPYRPLKIRIYDYNDSGKHTLLAEADCSAVKLKEMADSNGTNTLQLVRNGTFGGTLAVRSFSVEVRPTFLDYVRSGIELNFMVAVDFTGSNGDPRDVGSLHYLNPAGGYTPYEEAIMGVGRVLEAYDSDKVFQCVGFGGTRQGMGVQHCFPMGQQHDGSCHGVQGIMQAYRQALAEWSLSGPTLFTPVIRHATTLASRPAPHIKYLVLLILTDGAIMDMQTTVDAIVEASGQPMSILIVGIGNAAELRNMEVLDSDGKKLQGTGGRTAERDIVQFVRFAEHRNDGVALATELLSELPGQFLQYTRTRNIPLPAPVPTAPPGARA
mmetsp:Transcript_20448/g.44661  ORF Transcript_20448/g.44661 Transcript_20448/m.44661 type:complete len:569 (+) Transcript_20448:73-1779(+)